MPATQSKIGNRQSAIPASDLGLILALWLILLTCAPFCLAADAAREGGLAVPLPGAAPLDSTSRTTATSPAVTLDFPVKIEDHIILTVAQLQAIKDRAKEISTRPIKGIVIYHFIS